MKQVSLKINLKRANLKRTRLLSGILMSLLIASFSFHTMSHPKGNKSDLREMHQAGKGFSEERMMSRLSQLNLSEEQSSTIKLIVKKGVEESQAKRGEMKGLRMQLKAVKRSDTIDEKAIKSLLVSIANIKGDLLIMHLKKRQEVMVLLDDKQKQQFKQMRKDRKKKSR